MLCSSHSPGSRSFSFTSPGGTTADPFGFSVVPPGEGDIFKPTQTLRSELVSDQPKGDRAVRGRDAKTEWPCSWLCAAGFCRQDG